MEDMLESDVAGTLLKAQHVAEKKRAEWTVAVG